jgi:hypothetical protein
MHPLVILMLVIAGLICSLLFVALLTKKEYVVKRDIVVNMPRAQVFDYVRHLRNQGSYNQWWMIDPQVKIEFRGVDGSVGCVACWDSQEKKMGKGEQEIKNLVAPERIDFETRFLKPFESVANSSMVLESTSLAQTTLTWSFQGAYPWPGNFLLLILNMNKLLGPQMEMSLLNLKRVLEDQSKLN